MKIDPYRSKEQYLAWKAKVAHGIPGLSEENSRVLLRYLQDMEQGVNIGRGSRKGGRSYLRLATLRDKLSFLARVFETRYGASLLGVTEAKLHDCFTAMRSGELPKKDGGRYRSVADFVKIYRAFWHWHMKVQRKQEQLVDDICIDLDDSREKPPWVYLSEEEVRRLCNHAKFHYKALLLFLFDTGIRSPSELVNVRVNDLSEDCTQLRISDESSKTFGRTINLLLCPAVLREYLAEQPRDGMAQLFPINAGVTNRYLRRLAVRILGDKRSSGGAPYSKLSMYDLRHSAACYWLPRYKSESALKYRFGWKRSEMIHYYTEFLGMKDTITEEDLFTDGEKSVFERKAEHAEVEKRKLEDELAAMQLQINQVLTVVTRLVQKVG